MRHSVIGLLLAGLCLAGSAFAAMPWRDAVVEMSDGRVIDGQVSIVNDQIYVHVEAQQRKYQVRMHEMKQLENLIEQEAMEKKWIFKEDGRDEKVNTGELYPVRYFTTRVTYHDGKSLEGHVIGQTMYIKSNDKTERVWLIEKMEGKVGQKLDDLVYAKAVKFKEAGEGGLGTISGTVALPPGEKLKTMVAIHTRNDFCLEPTTLKGGQFRFTDCAFGTYDLVAVSDQAVYLAFSAEQGENRARFNEEQMKEIAAWAKEVRDYFTSHDVLYAAGGKARAYALVRMERYGNTSLEGLEAHRRYEAWLLEKPVDEWQIKKRYYLSRQISKQKEIPRERIVIRPDLAGIVVDAKNSNPALTLKVQADALGGEDHGRTAQP